MLRNAVRWNPPGAISPLSSKEAFVAEKPVRPVTVNLHIAITHHLRFYVAPLRRCVRISFAFSQCGMFIQSVKIFFSRNDATLRAKKQNLQGPP